MTCIAALAAPAVRVLVAESHALVREGLAVHAHPGGQPR